MARRIVRRSGGRGGESASVGDYEVRAVVEAKLLGLRLLSLKAHIVTGAPSSIAPLATALTTIPVTDSNALVVDFSPPGRDNASGTNNGASASLSEAMKLLEESNAALKQLPG